MKDCALNVNKTVPGYNVEVAVVGLKFGSYNLPIGQRLLDAPAFAALRTVPLSIPTD